LKKKIKLFAATTLHRADDHRIYHKEICSLLNDYDVTLLCSEDKIPKEFTSAINIEAIKSEESKLSRIKMILRIVRRLLREKNSIVIFHDFELIYAILLLRVFAGSNIYIFDMHEDYPSQILISKKIPILFLPLLSLFLMFSEMLLLPLFDWLFVADGFLEKKYGDMMNLRITAIYNFPEFTEIKRHVKSESELNLVYAGGIYFERGLKELVEIASRLKNSKLHLFGRTYTKMENDYLEEALKKNSNLIYHGLTPYDDLMKILPSMDIGLVMMKPNKKFRRNISVKQFDYMLSGIPVIIQKGLVSFVKDYENGFNVSSVEDAVSRINNLTAKDSARMSDNAISLIKEKYNWEYESKKIKSALEYLIILKGVSELQELHQDCQEKHL
jgi:glycosyltransferase involved in cell wall biosynthesis